MTIITFNTSPGHTQLISDARFYILIIIIIIRVYPIGTHIVRRKFSRGHILYPVIKIYAGVSDNCSVLLEHCPGEWPTIF